MPNYFLVIRANTPDELVKADFATISDATFDAITLIVQKENPAPIPPPAPRQIKVTYKGTLNVRRNPSASILTPITGSIKLGEIRTVLEENTDSAGNIWVKIGNYQWFARVYQGNIKAVYL